MYNEKDLRRPVDDFLTKEYPERKPYGTDTAKDYARIIHSRSFRRLQGKTQLFPCGESHLLRTRLTHSLEVAEVASRIAGRLNQKYAKSNQRHKIDVSIVAAAALAHDIGHPPFGHQGEMVLNEIMANYGGFEGNAQTLRVVTRNENRYSGKSPSRITFEDVYANPQGLNLLFRTIAAVLKYDRRTPINNKSVRPFKGYYATEHELVKEVKGLIAPDVSEPLKTLECHIMDLADDITYSTYDLEDCIEAGVATPMDVMSLSDDEIAEIQDSMNRALEAAGYKYSLTKLDVVYISLNIFSHLVVYARNSSYALDVESSLLAFYAGTHLENRLFSELSLNRRRWTEDFIVNCINAVDLRGGWNHHNLATTIIDINTHRRLEIEFLKSFNYIKAIRSKKLRLNDDRSRKVLSDLFRTFLSQPFDQGYEELSLFPHEYQLRYKNLNRELPSGLTQQEREWANQICEEAELKRVGANMRDNKITNWELAVRMRFVCDYISSLTDSEAIETFRKLRSGEVKSVFGLSF